LFQVSDMSAGTKTGPGIDAAAGAMVSYSSWPGGYLAIHESNTNACAADLSQTSDFGLGVPAALALVISNLATRGDLQFPVRPSPSFRPPHPK